MVRERAASFATLSEQQRMQAMARFAVLRPHLEEGVPLTRAAAAAGIPLRTAQRWLVRYRRGGATGLARPFRRDAGRHRASADLVALIEGMGLKKPRFSAAAIHRRVSAVAKAQGWRVPSCGTVRAILAGLDPAMVTLAQDGPAAFRDLFDRTGIGVILIGMPGIERRLSRYPQLYSRVGFAHHYRPLQGDELSFVLTRHWRQLGLSLDDADFTDAQAIAAIARITGGNFRLLHRLFVQIERILKINGLSVITDDVVEAARSTLVIGAT